MTDQTQDQTVATGLTSTLTPEPTVAESAASEPAPETQAETQAEPQPSDPPAEAPPSPAPPIEVAGLSAMADAELRGEATRENIARDFNNKVMAARAKRDAPEPAPQPVPDRIADQTKAEQEAGAAQVRRNEEHRAQHGGPRPNVEGTTTAVFRPQDYVPDQKKGQGYVNSRNI